MSTLESESLTTAPSPLLKQEANAPPQEAIARLAHSYWLERQNGHEGSAEEDWLRAERELRERNPARN
jgi:hypothetical protein